MIKIEWNGFLEKVTKKSRIKQESCAWIFSENPFSSDDTWHVFEVKNIGLKDYGADFSFAPDKNDFQRIKKLARKMKLTRIGNIHTHNVIGLNMREVDAQREPSDLDLKYARRYNDIIRGIIVVVFPNKKENGKIHDIIWHDQYGHISDLTFDLTNEWSKNQ